jgi:hypothetical protein
MTTSTMNATLSAGHVRVDPGTSLTFAGTINGTLDVAPEGHLRLEGALVGTLNVPAGATAEIAPGGSVAGVLRVDGVLDNRGRRSAHWTGAGQVNDLEGSTVC